MRETIEWALVASIWLLAVATCGVGQLRAALSGSPHSALTHDGSPDTRTDARAGDRTGDTRRTRLVYFRALVTEIFRARARRPYRLTWKLVPPPGAPVPES